MSSNGAVVEIARVVQGFATWVFLVTFWYDGEPFEYAAEVGTGLMSQAGAEATAKRMNLAERFRKAFLNEVYLEMAH